MNDKGVRIHDLARRLAVPTRELMTFLEKKGVALPSPMGSIDGPTADMLLQAFGAKGTRPQRSAAPKPQRQPIGRTYTPPKPALSKREPPPVRPTPNQPAQKPPERDAQPEQEAQSVRTSATPASPKPEDRQKKPRPPIKRERTSEPRGSENKNRPPVKRRQTFEPAQQGTGVKERPPFERGRTFDPAQQGTGVKRPPFERGRTFEPAKPDAGVKERPHAKHGRTFVPPSSEAEALLIEKTPGRTTGAKKREAPHKGPAGGTDRGANKKREFVRKGPAQNKGPVKKREDQNVEDQDAARKAGKPAAGRRHEKTADGHRHPVKPKVVTLTSDDTPTPVVKKPRRKPPIKAATLRPPVAPPPPAEKSKRVRIPEVIMLKALAEQMDIHPAQIIRHLMSKGILANVNQMLESEAAKSIAESFEFEVAEQAVDDLTEQPGDVVDQATLRPRPPVVTIMGHVDHGKTTLLDAIRESKVADSEFGGITQHIGAYAVDMRGQKVVFLDTPGHEAFTAMRARGAQVTDEVILVVAADDGIMPQTIEAIDHAKAANVPIIVAINKIDLPGANPDRVMQELTKYGLTPEDWGGETICVKLSAKQKINLDTLLEMILLQAEMLELKANHDCPAKGVVVEAMLDKGRGPVATVLVRNGTLRVGDAFVAGIYHGKVRAMFDDRGNPVKESGPSMPVEVIGVTGVPTAGDGFAVMDSDRQARQISERRQEQQQKSEFLKTGKITLEELHHHIKDGSVQELRIVIKADVHGSVEALGDALARLSTEKVRLQVIHGGVGAINETDVMLAAAENNAIVLGFNVRPVAKAREMAEKEQIDMRLYTIIYQAIDDIKKAMEGLLEPTYKEVLQGQANVQATFSVPKIGVVAGCRVVQGKITRNAIVKLYRDHKEVYKGTIASLRRVKDDVREVTNGYECGIKLENYNDIKEGDLIESYTLEKVIMTLDEANKQPR